MAQQELDLHERISIQKMLSANQLVSRIAAGISMQAADPRAGTAAA